MKKIENFTNMNNLNLDSIKEIALKRATAKTYFAIALLLLSLFAAFAITGKANRSVAIWSASSDLVAGDLITKSNIKKVKVFLPESSSKYLSANASIEDQIATRRIVSGELIPSSAISRNFSGESIRSVPLKISRNDLPSDLTSGQSVDIYSLPQLDINSQKNQKTELISEAVIVESIDIKSRDMGGDIGIVIKIPETDVISLLSSVNSSRIVVVRNAL